MKRLLLFLSFASLTIIANAQWQQTSLDSGLINCFAISGINIFAGTDNGVYLSSNNGSTWTAVNTGFTNTNVKALAISGGNIFAGTGDGIFLSSNNGNSWTAENTGFPTSAGVSALAISGGNIFAGNGDGVFFSSNNGNNWTAENTGLTNTYVWSLAISGDTLFAGTWGGGVFFSSNNGNNWTAVNTGMTCNYVRSLAISGNNIFTGTGGGCASVYLSTNNGNSWTDVNNGLNINNDVSAFAISGNNIFAGTANHGGVLFSSNNGGLWTAMNTGLTTGYSTDVVSLALSGDTLFAGTWYGGVWKVLLSEVLTVDAGMDHTIICGGTAQLNSITSNYTGTGTLSYLWSPSTGLNYDTISNPTATVTGNTKYFVTVTTSEGWTATDSVNVFVNPLTVSLNNTTTTCGSPVTLNTTNNYTGSGTLTYNWQPVSGLSAANVASPSANISSTTTYTVTLTTPDGCVATNQATVTLNPLPAREICYVEFDLATSKNRINWGTSLPSNIDTVNIYTEVSTNVWSPIGSTVANQTHFIDNNSNPFNQSYSYRISVSDTCGNKTDTSTTHTTVTLLAAYDQGTNTYGFSWSPYIGLTVPNYYLYGFTSSGTETLIGSVPGNQYFYNYTNPSLGFIKYFIGFNTQTCSNKTNHLVKSNWVQSTTGINELTGIDNLISVYPNPATNDITIENRQSIVIEILSIQGQTILQQQLQQGKTDIDISGLAKGIYILRLSSCDKTAVTRIVKE